MFQSRRLDIAWNGCLCEKSLGRNTVEASCTILRASNYVGCGTVVVYKYILTANATILHISVAGGLDTRQLLDADTPYHLNIYWGAKKLDDHLQLSHFISYTRLWLVVLNECVNMCHLSNRMLLLKNWENNSPIGSAYFIFEDRRTRNKQLLFKMGILL